MGHIHLLRLPGTKRWREVAELLAGEAAPEEILAASAVAAETQLAGLADEPGYVEALRLLALIPQAARDAHFGARLREIGLAVRDAPSLADLVMGVARRLEAESGSRSHLPELVRGALLAALTRRIGDALPSLLAPEAGDVQAAAARLARPELFAAAARDFLGQLTGDLLAGYLDRALSGHVGPGRRFGDARDRAGFDAALRQYCAEATRIVREFAGGWYGKTLFREGTIDTKNAAAFGAVALRKIIEELKRKRGADD